MFARGCGQACLIAPVALLVACGSKSPSAPDARNPTAELRVTGLAGVLALGATVQLTAELVLSNGTVKSCAAAWAVNDPRVASISSSGALTAAAAGYFTVTASCDGHDAALDSKVEAPSPYNWIVAVFDSEVRTEFGIAATMEFLDGPRAGQQVSVGSVNTSISGMVWPVKVRLTAESYQTKDVILAESTGSRRNPFSSLFDFSVPMTFVTDPSTDTYVRAMSSTEMEIAHPFTMRTTGPVRVRTWWSVDYNDILTIGLWCGGQMLRMASQRAGSAGNGFTQDVPGPGACEVRLRQVKSDAHTRYRVAITYPR
jgi:hypothetical protein